MEYRTGRAKQVSEIVDHWERLRECVATIDRGEQTLVEVRALRDDTIRKLRGIGATRPEISQGAGVSHNVVVAAISAGK